MFGLKHVNRAGRDGRDVNRAGREVLFVGWLLNVPATG